MLDELNLAFGGAFYYKKVKNLYNLPYSTNYTVER